ncbi:MAG: nucleotidyltransferase domain-containing protein, partial [Bacilli bacterium]|nr:nucleotidyltransferase domain-containing protein [Bacilli bacterium]
HEVYLFGSYARGEAKSNSDVDIYCEAGDIKSFIDQGFLEDELSKALGKDVDIVFIGSKMDDFFKNQLEEDKIRIF